MLPVGEALRIVLSHCRPLPPEIVPINAGSLGLILAEDVASDLDSPPFDKSLMDGYAVRLANLNNGRATLPVAAEVTAGQVPPALAAGQAIRIMTGAPVPAGADCVVRIEHTRMQADGQVAIESTPPKPGQFILRRASEMKAGDVVLPAGEILGPQELGLLAGVGRTSAGLFPRREFRFSRPAMNWSKPTKSRATARSATRTGPC